MRDTRKGARYFESYIEYQKGRIEKKKQKLSVSNGSVKERVSRTLLMYQIDMLVAKFSYNATGQELTDLINEICDTAKNLRSLDYEQLQIILSISVMTGNSSDKIITLIRGQSMLIDSDKLLHCLAAYICDRSVEWSGTFLYDIFSALDSIDRAGDRQKVLSDYLNSWYSNHKDFAWYDSDKNDKNTYVGYWSFESAALSVIFKVSDDELKKNPYYPSI